MGLQGRVRRWSYLQRLCERGVGLDGRAEHVVGLYCTRPESLLRRNSAARRLTLLGYERDLDLCLTERTVLVVPRLEGYAFTGRKAH